MYPLSPPFVGLGDARRRGGCYRHDLKAELSDQECHFSSHVRCADTMRVSATVPAEIRRRSSASSAAIQAVDSGSSRTMAIKAEVSTTIIEADRRRHRESPGCVQQWVLHLPWRRRLTGRPQAVSWRAPLSGSGWIGTRRTTACPWRVRMTSSPASGRRTRSVNWPLAWVTDTCVGRRGIHLAAAQVARRRASANRAQVNYHSRSSWTVLPLC